MAAYLNFYFLEQGISSKQNIGKNIEKFNNIFNRH